MWGSIIKINMFMINIFMIIIIIIIIIMAWCDTFVCGRYFSSEYYILATRFPQPQQKHSQKWVVVISSTMSTNQFQWSNMSRNLSSTTTSKKPPRNPKKNPRNRGPLKGHRIIHTMRVEAEILRTWKSWMFFSFESSLGDGKKGCIMRI